MVAALTLAFALADPVTYLKPLVQEMSKSWPQNRTVTIVCHGHSVPAGYFKTPTVDTFNAYPHLLHVKLKERFPLAVINVIVTAIGGEDSVSGAKRFDRDVLPLHPDVVTIDYGLNDRHLALADSKKAWTEMVQKCKDRGIKVILFTPSPDQSAKILDDADSLSQQATQIRAIAAESGVALVDSYARFREIAAKGGTIADYMSQVNHPNRKGHDEICGLITPWFFSPVP